MNVEVSQENLAKGLSIVNRAVNARSTNAVLGNVLIETDLGRLKLCATNSEIAVTCWVDAEIIKDEENNSTGEGSTTVPARTVTDLVSSLPQGDVSLTLDTETETLHIECGSTEANLKGIPSEKFPEIPEPILDGAVEVEGGRLQQMINQVAFAAAVDDTRPILRGVSTTFESGMLKMAATDAFRLSVRETKINYDGEAVAIVIPARALAEVARVITNDKESVKIALSPAKKQVMFVMEDVIVMSLLVEGTFPDFTPIIPNSYKTKAVIDTASLLKACRTAAIFARESSHTVRVAFDPGDGTPKSGFTSISANSAETGDNVVEVRAGVEGERLEIAFNVKYMSDVLNIIDTPQVVFETTTKMEPGLVRPLHKDDKKDDSDDDNVNNSDNKEFFHIIMPMHF